METLVFPLFDVNRALCDHQTMEGTEYILSAFNSESDKIRALERLSAVSAYASEEVPAGGHFVPRPMGSITSASIPQLDHLYGPLKKQFETRYVSGYAPFLVV